MNKRARFFKQLASIAVAAVLAACLAGCGFAQDTANSVDSPKPAENGKVEAAVEVQTYPCVKDFLKADGPSEGELSIAFVEGGDIPYVALTEYMPFLSEALSGVGSEGVEYTVERIEADGHILADYYDPKRTYDPAEFVIKGEDDDPVDTVDLIRYANEQINRKGSPVKNVVVDLSNNGGGNSDAAVFTISWLLGSADVALRDTFTGAQTFMSCTSDTNLNNLYGERDDTLIQKDINVYCLISPSSFSCGNLVPAALKLSHRATLLGQTSGGGSCVVLPCTTASGTFFQISGSKQLALPKNGSFYNIDSGIEPDVVLTKEESYYDREALVAYLHGLK